MTALDAPERHLFGLAAGTANDPRCRDFLIGRLLEDGDRSDLAWLGRTFGRETLADFVRRHGGRKLSARSRRFWSSALGVETPAAQPLAEAVWPLA